MTAGGSSCFVTNLFNALLLGTENTIYSTLLWEYQWQKFIWSAWGPNSFNSSFNECLPYSLLAMAFMKIYFKVNIMKFGLLARHNRMAKYTAMVISQIGYTWSVPVPHGTSGTWYKQYGDRVMVFKKILWGWQFFVNVITCDLLAASRQESAWSICH